MNAGQQPLDSLSSVQRWSAVAPYWRYLEDRGLAERHLRTFDAQFASPVLVVGAGQGFIMAALERLAFDVRGIDFSSAMARTAKERRGYDITVADAHRLPFDAESFGSIVVATGVLRPDSPATSLAVLRECARVGIVAAPIVVTCLATSEHSVATIAGLGLAKGRTYNVSRIHQLWLARSDASRQAELIAEWIGLDRLSASKRLGDYRSLVDGLFGYHALFAGCLASSGGNVEAAIAALANLDAQPFTGPELARLLREASLTVLDEAIDFDAGVYVALTKGDNEPLGGSPIIVSAGLAR
jgi:protein-L-isoaspartate O-methyltransferase